MGPIGGGLGLAGGIRDFAPDPSSTLLVGLGGLAVTLVGLYLNGANAYFRDLTNRDAGSRELAGFAVGIFFCGVTSAVGLFALSGHSGLMTWPQLFLLGWSVFTLGLVTGLVGMQPLSAFEGSRAAHHNLDE